MAASHCEAFNIAAYISPIWLCVVGGKLRAIHPGDPSLQQLAVFSGTKATHYRRF